MATKYTDIHIKIDSNIKSESEEILDQIGISMTDLINMTLRRVIRERQIPFSTKIDQELPENMKIETREQLIEALDKRTREANGRSESSEEFWNNFAARHQEVGERELAHA